MMSSTRARLVVLLLSVVALPMAVMAEAIPPADSPASATPVAAPDAGLPAAPAPSEETAPAPPETSVTAPVETPPPPNRTRLELG